MFRRATLFHFIPSQTGSILQDGDGAFVCPSYQYFVPYPQLQGYSNLLGNRKDFFISYVLDMTFDNNSFKCFDHRISLDQARFEPTTLMAICVGRERAPI